MLLNVLSILAGLVLLTLGAEGLVRGAASAALRLGLTPLLIGLTVVAMATGSPELFVSLRSALAGDGGIALGNVVGSNIANLCLVLGASALARPLHVRSVLVRREMPLLIATTILLVLLLRDGQLGRMDGAILVVSALAYTAGAYRNAKREAKDIAAEEYSDEVARLRSGWLEALYLAGGLAALVAGASLLTSGAVGVATALGVSSAVIALSVIAIGTSLPELATSVSAARRGEPDVAFGNVIGSNIFNILGVLGTVALIQPFAAHGVRPLDAGILLATPLLVAAMMAWGWKLTRLEGAVLLAVYAGYLVSLVA